MIENHKRDLYPNRFNEISTLIKTYGYRRI